MPAFPPLGAVVAGALLLTACGTTVPHGGAATDGLGPVGQAATQSTSGQQLGSGPGSGLMSGGPFTTSVGGAKGVASPGATTGPTGSEPSLPGDFQLGPGVTATTVQVGFTVQQNNSTASSIASTYNVQLPDNRAAYEALVKDVNAHGGIGGRKLVPVFYSYDPSSGTAAQIGQAACASFTQDHQVFAALDAFVPNDTFNTCMQKKGRVLQEYGLFFGSSTSWSKYSNEVAADGLPFEQGGRILAEHLAGTGFLSSSTRLGVLVRSSRDLTEAYQHGFVPALTQHGLKVQQTYYLRDAQAASDISGYTADISSAVLKFASNGIDRVVFFDTGSYSALVFSQTAQQQQYHPRYGLMSLNGIVTLAGSGSEAPPQQMVGAQGVSWEMNADGLATTRTRDGQRCLAILRAAGIDTSNNATDASYLETCQSFFLFRRTATAAGGNLNRDTFLAAVEGLGSSFVSTNTWGGVTSFGPGRHHGVAVYRPFSYDQKCGCFAVTGPAQPVGSS